MTLIEAARAFVKACPYIEAFTGDTVSVDRQRDLPHSYSVDPTADTITKRYTCGRMLRRYAFVLSTVARSADDYQRAANSEFLERIVDWINELNRTKDFPELDPGKKIYKISCENGMIFREAKDGRLAEYHLQLYFFYEQE